MRKKRKSKLKVLSVSPNFASMVVQGPPLSTVGLKDARIVDADGNQVGELMGILKIKGKPATLVMKKP